MKEYDKNTYFAINTVADMNIKLADFIEVYFRDKEGEVLALTRDDIDCENSRMRINKTFFRVDQRDVISAPKTVNSIRTVELPEFLPNELERYQTFTCGISYKSGCRAACYQREART